MKVKRLGLSLAAAILAAGCGGNPDLVTVRVLDPLQLVEVRQTPLPPFPGMERMWRRIRHDRVDTVPGVRAIGPVTVVGENRVIGFHSEDRGVPEVFEYDAFSRTLNLSALPRWFHEAVLNPPPRFAPGGRHVLFFARLPNGMVRAEVHSWPDGAETVAGLPMRPNPRSDHSLVIEWGNASEFLVSVPVVSDTGPIVLIAHGRVSGTQAWFDSATRYVDVKQPPTPRGLRPSALPTLPRDFRAELERRGCTVQQAHRSENVISGHFGSSTQVDWAALCSQRGQSTILVHWGGAAQCPGELRPAPDYLYQMRLGERVAFVRSIQTTDRYQVHDEMGRPVLPPRFVKLDHDAIEDMTGDVASTVWWCQGGQWVDYPGRGSEKSKVLPH